MPKAELHTLITERLGIPPENIICEYGMSELSFSGAPSFYTAAGGSNPEPANSSCGPGYTGPFGPNPLPYNFGSIAAGTPFCVAFPGGTLPSANLSPLALKIANQFVPLPNAPNNEYSFNPSITGVTDQFIERVDQNLGDRDAVWAYAFYQRHPRTQVLPFVGSTLPGFPEIDFEHDQQYAVSWNHTFSPTTLNKVRFGYFRFNYNSVNPQNPINPTAYGFTGINPQNPAVASMPFMEVAGFFDLGFSLYGPQPRKENTYQFIDNFSKVLGRHTLKLGFSMARYSVYNPFYNSNAGAFFYNGAGTFSTGNPGADFLLGLPDSYTQTNGSVIDASSREYYSYFQDEFKLRPNFTVTYGAGWDVETPYLNRYYGGKLVNAFRPGQQSTIFPTAPTGVLWPGDKGINSAGGVNTPTHDFGPRVGFAWSPGGASKWSIHSGFGVYFNRTEEELALQNLSTPPFFNSSLGVGHVGGSPAFATPFSGWCKPTGGGAPAACSTPNQFPYTPPAAGSQFNFGPLEPLLINSLSPNFGVPYSENYNFTIERQLDASTTMSIAYVGNVGRHLEGDYELNPAGNAQGLNPVAVTLGCNQANLGTCAPQTFRYNPLTTNLGAINHQGTEFNSRYNSLQVSVNKRFTHGLSFVAAYTWSRYFDQNSSADLQDAFVEPGINPFNFASQWAPSNNDAPQRFVFSYSYTVPIYHYVPHVRALTDGWKLSGITTFQQGFPLMLYNSGGPSDTCWSAIENDDVPCWDRPNRVSGVSIAHGNPHTYSVAGQSNYWFNPAAFAAAAPGTGIGNASRDPLYGPGFNNFDIALEKDIHFTENKYLELRLETYNTFNHTQWAPSSYQPTDSDGGVVSDVNSPHFGQVIATNPARIIQLGMKIYF